MKYFVAITICSIILFTACKKDPIKCLQSEVTLTYDTYSQYDSTYTEDKICLRESEWGYITFESMYDPTTGLLLNNTEVGTFTSRYYDSNRSDSVTRVQVTTEVSDKKIVRPQRYAY